MTPVASLPAAGRELDALVAERVMGFAHRECRAAEEDIWISADEVLWLQLPDYSTRMHAAWGVVGCMDARGWPLYQVGALVSFGKSTNAAYAQFAQAWPPKWHRAEAPTSAQAICWAALKAVAP